MTLFRLWDKELCKEMGRLSKRRKSRKSVVYYANKYKDFVKKERDSTASVSLG